VTDRAESIVQAMERAFAPRPPRPERPRILVEWWPRPVIVPGRDSWVTQVLDAAGAVNPMGDRPVKSAPITDDEALALAPDAVVIAWCGVPFAKYRPDVVYRRDAWKTMRALRNGHVYAVPEAFLGRPSPRLVEGVHAMRRIVDAVSGP
jgi:iron complex transport system substrate-binding protein